MENLWTKLKALIFRLESLPLWHVKLKQGQMEVLDPGHVAARLHRVPAHDLVQLGSHRLPLM